MPERRVGKRPGKEKSGLISKGSYTPPSYDNVQRRSHSGGSRTDPMLPEDVEIFTPKEGRNRVRILPPFWGQGPSHEFWSYEFYVHYGIGAEDGNYICPERTAATEDRRKEKCPVCAEARSLHNDGNQEEAKSFWPKNRRGMWIIDRAAEDESPKLWLCAKTLDDDIADIACDPDNNEVLNLCDANEGRDVHFHREGQGLRTRYTGVKISTRESALCGDPEKGLAWVEYAEDNPLSDVLIVYGADHIAAVLTGEVEPEHEEEEDPADAEEEEEDPYDPENEDEDYVGQDLDEPVGEEEEEDPYEEEEEPKLIKPRKTPKRPDPSIVGKRLQRMRKRPASEDDD